jgi:hypothetical protein
MGRHEGSGGSEGVWRLITPQERLTGNSPPNLEAGPAAFGGTFSWENFLMVLQKFRLLVKYLPF